jgi:hypothetical protein
MPFIEMLPEIFRTAVGGTLLVVMVFWTAFWTILALYRAASRKHKVWFVVLFFINTVGILEILYLLILRNRPKRA